MVVHLFTWLTSRFCLLLLLLLQLQCAGVSSKEQVSAAESPLRNCTASLWKTLIMDNGRAEEGRKFGNEFLTIIDPITAQMKTICKESTSDEFSYRKLQTAKTGRLHWGGYVPLPVLDFTNAMGSSLPFNESADEPSFVTASPALPRSSSAQSLDPSSSLGSSPSLPSSVRAADRYWCIARPWANQDALQAALDWACSVGGAACSWIQLAQPCFVPNTLLSHASFAFNSYFQIHQQASGTCDFGGTAMITNEDPSYPGCNYPFRQGQVGAPIGKGSSRHGVWSAAVLCQVLVAYLLL